MRASAPVTAPPKGDLIQLARIARFLAPYRWRIAGELAALVVAAGCVLALGQGLRHVIDAGFGSGDPHLLNAALAAVVAVSVVRERGVLITSIMVAGRSGSAFTAEIGVMKTREEVDALKAMGIEPMQVLVVPRVIALVITLPLLTFFADIMGLVGGAAISQFLLDLSPTQYLTRLPQVVDGSDLFVGLIKAPVFAFFIAVIGCMHGLKVSGSAESVGRETTRAVVKAIFVVIALDAFFSILFERIGI